MSRQLTITVTDATYASLQSAAGNVHRTPEELAAQAVVERFSAATQATTGYDSPARDALLAVMRRYQHLVEYAPKAALPGAVTLPPQGSPERARLDEEVAGDLGAALALSGLSVLDLIERR